MNDLRLDIDLCKNKLNDLLLRIDNSSPDELVEELCDVLASSKKNFNRKHHVDRSHEIEVLKRETKEAFTSFLINRNKFSKDVYIRLRRDLQNAVKKHKVNVKANLVAKTIDETREHGISALYKSAKRTAASSSAVSLLSLIHI